MQRGTWRAAATVLAPASIAASAIVGCSLLTDLGGLTGGETAAPGRDATSTEATTSQAEASAGPDAAMDARPVDTGPYVPRYERSFAITNASTSSVLPAGYTACFRGVASDVVGIGAGKLRADAADLRIFAGGVELKRVVDIFRTGIISTCFRLVNAIGAGATDTSYAVRYGDPNATPPLPVESDVFDFFDGFDGTAVSPRWLTFGAPVVAGGFVTFPKNAPSAITTMSGPDGIPLDASLEINARVPNPTSDGQLQDDAGTRYFYWLGFQHQGDFIPDEPWTVFIARSKSTINAEHKTSSGTCVNGCNEAPGTQTTDARVYKVDRAGDTAVFTYDTGATFQGVGSSGDQSVMIRNYLLTSELVVDWVRARPLVLPEPTPVLGDEVVIAK